MAWSPLASLDAAGTLDQNLSSARILLYEMWNTESISGLARQCLKDFVNIKMDKSLAKFISSLENNELNVNTEPCQFEQWLSDYFSILAEDQNLLKVQLCVVTDTWPV
jgi:hypothetical protein